MWIEFITATSSPGLVELRQVLLKVWRISPELRCGRKERSFVSSSFGLREMLDYCTSYSCTAVSGKVLFKSKSPAKSMLSTLGRVQPLCVKTRELDLSQFSKGLPPTVVLSSSFWSLDPGFFFFLSMTVSLLCTSTAKGDVKHLPAQSYRYSMWGCPAWVPA